MLDDDIYGAVGYVPACLCLLAEQPRMLPGLKTTLMLEPVETAYG
jgi:hypothetical protein